MNAPSRLARFVYPLIAALVLATLGSLAAAADLKLSGDNEVPPVKTMASGGGTITVTADGSVSGSVKTTGLAGMAAHIHVGAPGKNGPVIIPLTKGAEGEWSVPAGAKLSPEQMASYKAGDLYVNVHTEANKGGELRAQIVP
jgi:CHRD domain